MMILEKPMSEDLYVSKEDLEKIKDARINSQITALNAEKATLEHRLAEAEYKNVVAGIFIKHKLNLNDIIDEVTGKVIKQ